QFANEEIANGSRDLLEMRLQGKVSRVVKMHLGIRVITLKGLGTRRKKERIVFAPNRKHRWPFRSEIFLELGIESYVACVIQEQIELDLVIPGTCQESRVELVRFRRKQRRVRHSVRVLPLGRRRLEEFTQGRAIFCAWFFPILLDGVPTFAQPFCVSVAVLRDDGRDSFGMRQGKPQSDRCAVVENVDGKAC